MNYLAQMVEAKRKTLDVAMFHQESLDEDDPAIVKNEHAKEVARARRALNKAIKESEKESA